MALWEKMVIGIAAVLILLWMLPGTRNMVEASRDAPKDWMGVLVPIAAVVLFVVFLAVMV